LVVEVTNVSGQGFWLLVGDRELFVPFDDFPWFRHASIGQLLRVERPNAHHLYWPELDVDLAVESIINPERYPLVSRIPVDSGREHLTTAARRKRRGSGNRD
jgi:hypothetical protein